MDSKLSVAKLKKWLLHDVAYLSQRADVRWSNPIVETIRELRQAGLPAVYFGGTLRSLLLARLNGGKRLGRPRDLDIVVAGSSMKSLRERLRGHIVRETRFGGIKVERSCWQFDLWPLASTWAFTEDASLSPSFEALPETTFFNLEAIAVDVWVKPGMARKVYSGNDSFFEGILSRTIELNRESNPFPALCIVRSLVLASTTKFAIGPRLISYLAQHAERVSDAELDDAQQHHYGKRRFLMSDMRRILSFINRSQRKASSSSRLHLPITQQLHLWEDLDGNPKISFHVLK